MSEKSSETRIVRCWLCKGMMRVPIKALSVFCPHCQKRASIESLTITGTHPGKKLMTCGDILVQSTARLHVELYGNSVVIHGKVRGPVEALEYVEVGKTGRVLGDIRAPRIVIRDGAVVDGRCEMTRRWQDSLTVRRREEGIREESPAVETPTSQPAPEKSGDGRIRPRPLRPPPDSATTAGTGQAS